MTDGRGLGHIGTSADCAILKGSDPKRENCFPLPIHRSLASSMSTVKSTIILLTSESRRIFWVDRIQPRSPWGSAVIDHEKSCLLQAEQATSRASHSWMILYVRRDRH